jgi:two-component system, cell cycle response regulator
MDNPSYRNAGPAKASSTPGRTARQSGHDELLGSSIFGPLDPEPVTRPPAVAAKIAPALKLVVQGLRPVERQLLEGLVKVSQRRTPRLEILDSDRATEADVIMIDTRDPAAMSWTRHHTWIETRAVIWIDGTEAPAGHTLLRRPVQWPILPVVLARALEGGPGTAARGMSSVAVAAPGASALSAPQILVVDDSLAARAHLRSLLEPRGFVVTDADSVEVALQSVAQRAFDCVLMEAVMPEVDGYEGCRQIKARLRGESAVPVVMLGSKGSAFDRIRGKMAGCDAYETKPVDPGRLGEVLAKLVRAAPTQRVAAAMPRPHRPLSPPRIAPSFVPTRPA